MDAGKLHCDKFSSLSAIIPRLGRSVARLFCRARRLFFFAHTGSGSRSRSRSRNIYFSNISVGAAVAKAAADRFMPDSADDGLPVPVFWNKPTVHYLRSPSVPQTVLVCGMCFCMYARVTSSVLFVFMFTYALCPSVHFPMSLSCILYSYNCAVLLLSIHSSV